ncbi:MAG TPA: hypothetical protein VK447_20505, partial [Myxococcaceae bacterium]|nr:hypothetical protein [Myxococcaceae bacterium]
DDVSGLPHPDAAHIANSTIQHIPLFITAVFTMAGALSFCAAHDCTAAPPFACFAPDEALVTATNVALAAAATRRRNGFANVWPRRPRTIQPVGQSPRTALHTTGKILIPVCNFRPTGNST